MHLLLLRLEGPMQSWGEHGKWDKVRDSALMPTKSGVLGLIGCCMGLDRGHPTLVHLAQSLQMSVRADRGGTLQWDYHTVTVSSGVTTANRKKKNDTIVSSRAYLENASFLVILSGEASLLLQCKSALEAPVWTPFLGRKSCTPSRPLLVGLTDTYTSPLEAMQHHPLSLRHDTIIQAQVETSSGGQVRGDQLIDSSSRRFSKRNVSLEVISCT